MKIKTAVIGATGYTGFEVIKLLLNHPFVELSNVMASEASQDKPIEELYPQLRSVFKARCEAYRKERLDKREVDLVLTATPDKVSVEIIPEILEKGIRVIDLSGAFRLKDPALYPKWYGFEHKASRWLSQAVYGLPEINGIEIANASLIANPGCYPTAILLPLIPLLEAGLVDTNHPIICDAKSGVTGAGKVLNAANLFAEVNENFKAYNVFSHRHTPEINQQLGRHYPEPIFVAHLLPINRGILATIYLQTKEPVTHQQIEAIFRTRYAESRFIRLYERGNLPEIKYVTASNYCDLGWVVSENGRSLVILSAIDNLVKGAAGQAVQNLNLMYGIEETVGIS